MLARAELREARAGRRRVSITRCLPARRSGPSRRTVTAAEARSPRRVGRRGVVNFWICSAPIANLCRLLVRSRARWPRVADGAPDAPLSEVRERDDGGCRFRQPDGPGHGPPDPDACHRGGEDRVDGREGERAEHPEPRDRPALGDARGDRAKSGEEDGPAGDVHGATWAREPRPGRTRGPPPSSLPRVPPPAEAGCGGRGWESRGS